MKDLIKCIQYLYPMAKTPFDFKLKKDSAGEIQIVFWNEAKLGDQPTQEKLLESLPEAEAHFALELCRAHRRREYPPIADYLDGIVKGDQVQVQKYIDDCLAVKAKYPKP